LLVSDRMKNPSKYAIAIVSEGATFEGIENMSLLDTEKDMFGHAKLGGIGLVVGNHIKDLTPKFNHGNRINIIHQNLGYLVRGGDPDAIDSIVPMAFGNLALDLILKGIHGRLVILKNGRYGNAPIEVVTASKKFVVVQRHYNTERLRPQYNAFDLQPLFVMTGTE